MQVQAKLLEFSMPTMCVYNGKAIAGGAVFGFGFDKRVMNELNGKGQILLNEV